MARDVAEVFTPDRLWRCRINAWKTSVFFFNEVGGSILVDKLVRGHWTKTPGNTIHLMVSLVGASIPRVVQVSDTMHPNAGYRDWRAKQYGASITFGASGPGLGGAVGDPTFPRTTERVRAVRASGDVIVPGYGKLILPEVCSGDLCP
jgi:hypothetical protein